MTEDREQCDCPTCGRIHWKMPFTRSDGGPIPKIGKSLLGPTIKVGLNNDGANLSQNEHVALRARVAQLEEALQQIIVNDDAICEEIASRPKSAHGVLMMFMSMTPQTCSQVIPPATGGAQASTFHLAIDGVVNRGEKWRRRDWNRPHFISLVEVSKFGGQIAMTMRDGLQGAWSPSQCDMRADDWELLDHSQREQSAARSCETALYT